MTPKRNPLLVGASLLLFAFFMFASSAASPSRRSQGPPPLPYVARGACPFECCTYGRWRARIAFDAHPREREKRAVSFRVAPGDSVEAITGNVHVIRPGLVIVRKAFLAPQDSANVRLARGDSIWLLDTYGEGAQSAWHRGRRVTLDMESWHRGDWGSPGDPPPPCRLIREAKVEWWVQIRDAAGRVGWILMRDDDLGMDGADACG